MPSNYISCYTCQALLLHRDYLCAYSSKCGVTFHLCGSEKQKARLTCSICHLPKRMDWIWV
ncbi:hypothetical protein Celaphus_00013982 [Cervus elaphus hippelaphus]|uniref:Uncharacterized protein n=1 Tax=Cervus elaphus hippelaphus TaxID=46360 RepID=A0A212CDE6_CEREH|nr:hypothetical protein Celaphus_00013982 [Cervus elaphus hippelaphus]